jgi:hypothetical protein
MTRRSLLRLLGSAAAALPLAVRAQTVPPPIIGYLSQGTPEGTAVFVAAVRKGPRRSWNR